MWWYYKEFEGPLVIDVVSLWCICQWGCLQTGIKVGIDGATACLWLNFCPAPNELD